MRHRYHSIIRSNPLKGDLAQSWTQPPSSSIGLWIIGHLWPAKMHLGSLYVTCLCDTPISRSTGLIYKPEGKKRHVATNAWQAANGIEWHRGEQKGHWVMERYWWQHWGTRICQQQISNPAPWQSLRRSFLWNGRTHGAECADHSPQITTQFLCTAGLPPEVYSFLSAYRVPGQHHTPAPFFQ